MPIHIRLLSTGKQGRLFQTWAVAVQDNLDLDGRLPTDSLKGHPIRRSMAHGTCTHIERLSAGHGHVRRHWRSS
jgi:hypothetical protein